MPTNEVPKPWPATAVPERIIKKLFDRMTAIYGQRFIDMWREVDPVEFMHTWARALRHVKPFDFRRGTAALLHAKYPPTLPEFLDLCRPQPQQFVTHAMLTDESTKITPEGFARLQRIKEHLMGNPAFLPNSPRADGIQWAYKLLDRAAKGQGVNAMQVAFAEEAIRRWHLSRHVADINDDEIEMPVRIASPYIVGDAQRMREPGDDDEEIAA
ncbi:hypothetical protein [Caballeronia cordobensis]|uniref:hypothetical protein n=1 Tax=Caballeronia cordobensis TaxID=1353886 RepID=UPI00045F0585|nr:uncharacterized protein BRPE67_BCDS11380 [Burkholderia sp. RPE67]